MIAAYFGCDEGFARTSHSRASLATERTIRSPRAAGASPPHRQGLTARKAALRHPDIGGTAMSRTSAGHRSGGPREWQATSLHDDSSLPVGGHGHPC